MSETVESSPLLINFEDSKSQTLDDEDSEPYKPKIEKVV